uniref:Uncharacterized protein n=1 Tax=Glossina austeni TaxID=7395 RepID=A0A1A9UMA9_GLOAU
MLTVLPQETVLLVLDFNRDPWTVKIDDLKKIFIERHFLSENTRLEKTLTNFDMGDRRLAEFYRNLLILGGSNFTPEMIKKLWIKKLSKSLSVALIGSNIKNINELVKLSDDFREVSNHSGAHTLAVTSSDTNN